MCSCLKTLWKRLHSHKWTGRGRGKSTIYITAVIDHQTGRQYMPSLIHTNNDVRGIEWYDMLVEPGHSQELQAHVIGLPTHVLHPCRCFCIGEMPDMFPVRILPANSCRYRNICLFRKYRFKYYGHMNEMHVKMSLLHELTLNKTRTNIRQS